MAKDKDTSPKGKYRVKSPLHHDDERYEPGEAVELTEKQAKRLGAVVEPLDPKTDEKAS